MMLNHLVHTRTPSFTTSTARNQIFSLKMSLGLVPSHDHYTDITPSRPNSELPTHFHLGDLPVGSLSCLLGEVRELQIALMLDCWIGTAQMVLSEAS